MIFPILTSSGLKRIFPFRFIIDAQHRKVPRKVPRKALKKTLLSSTVINRRNSHFSMIQRDQIPLAFSVPKLLQSIWLREDAINWALSSSISDTTI
jgi:hypothetical protein